MTPVHALILVVLGYASIERCGFKSHHLLKAIHGREVNFLGEKRNRGLLKGWGSY